MFWIIVRKLKPLLAPGLEKYYRIVDSFKILSLKVQGKSTIKRIVNPENVTNEKIAIFAAYPNGKLAHCHERFLEKLRQQGYSIIFATNHPKIDKFLPHYKDLRWTFILRHPIGRDFGCYKDATQYITNWSKKNNTDIKKVIYVNDSIITFEKSEKHIIEYLDNAESDFSGITENYNHAHHVGSFLFSISGEALHHPKFQKYWKKYKSYSTRRYSIKKGELGISKTLKKCGYAPEIMYRLSNIKLKLEQFELERLAKLMSHLEPHFKKQWPSIFSVTDPKVDMLVSDQSGNDKATTIESIKNFFGKDKSTNLIPIMQPSGQNYRQESAEEFDYKNLSIMRYRESLLGIDQELQRTFATTHAKESIVDVIVKYIFRGSQIHHGAATLLFIDAGLMKKDVVFRRLVEPQNVEKLLIDSGISCNEDEIKDSVREMLSKGHPFSLNKKERLLYDWDFI